MASSALRVVCAGLLLLCFQGCSIWKYELGTPLQPDDAPNPQLETDVGSVMQRLGPPQRMSSTASGYILAWEYWAIDERSLGFSLGAGGADLLSVDWGKARARGLFLIVNFDHQHQLLGSAWKEWDSEVGGGRAVQPLFGIVSVVDVDDLIDDMPQHTWGATWLGRLPKTLNAVNAPESGQAGIEQRGTPRSIGQHSLELR